MTEENKEYKSYRFVKKYDFSDTNTYFDDLDEIENSMSGRIDITSINAFIIESVQLIKNSIALFMQGYFDAAYYSLRASIEISTTLVYLVDMPEDKKKENYEKWINLDNFPLESQMRNQLYENGSVMTDMKSKMGSFFEEVQKTNKKINKYIHKQGFQYFYIKRVFNTKEDDNKIIEEYRYFLEKTIGIVAVMRLAIDPLPILLNDEEFLYRFSNSISEPYSNDFIKKYIGNDDLDEYKKTEMYNGYYNAFMRYEKKNESIFMIEKYQMIDTTKKNEILAQIHLLNEEDKYAVYVVLASEKIIEIYTPNPLIYYPTEREYNNSYYEWDKERQDIYEANPQKYNHKYKNFFVSVFKFETKYGEKLTFFVTHNEELTEEEIKEIEKMKI